MPRTTRGVPRLATFPSAALALQHTPSRATAPLEWDPAGLVLSRFAFGPDLSSRNWVDRYGPDAWWAWQIRLGHTSSGYRGSVPVQDNTPLLGLSPPQLQDWLKHQNRPYAWDAMIQMSKATLGLQCWSRAQLYESLVQFFGDHLHVANNNQDLWTTRHTMDRDVIRRHAFGSFRNMLTASARNPAMLQYLGLSSSNKVLVNENYGRELLELHTVGAGCYSETDVLNSSRILTGRTLGASRNFRYDLDLHWTGAITVLGFQHPNLSPSDGLAASDTYLTYLARHPRTAHRIAQKLCVRFVSDSPSPTLVASVARAYLAHDTAILPTVHAIFTAPEFWASRGLKVRRPMENVVAAVRGLELAPTDWPRALGGLYAWSSSVGQIPYAWQSPDGYPAVAAAWRSSTTLVHLWELHRLLTQNVDLGLRRLHPVSLFRGHQPATAGQALDLLTTTLTGQNFPALSRAALLRFVGDSADTAYAESELRKSPAKLLPLILDGPHHAYC